MNEIWKDIDGYVGKYQISNLGRVKSLNYNRENKEKILVANINNVGYYKITLSKNDIRKNYYIHDLVAKHFVPNFNDNNVINHIDGNKLNNNINNLEWVTSSENTKHAFENKLIQPRKKRVIQLDTQNNIIKIWDSIREATKSLNINGTLIIRCCKNKGKTAGGYRWQYVEGEEN